MSLNSLRRVKSRWGRADAATDTVKVQSMDHDGDATRPGRETNDALGGVQVQREVQTSEPFHATSVNDSQVPSFSETSEGSQKHKQGYVRHESIDSDVTLDQENDADDQTHRSQAAGDRQTNVPLGRYCEEQVLEVSSDDECLPNRHTSSEDPPLRRRNLTPHRLFKRTVEKTYPKYPSKLDMNMEKSTEDNPLPESYLHTYNGARYFKTFIDLTESCGVAPGLHKLICGHWISTPTPQPCGVTCHAPVLENEAFRCTECCDMVRTILDVILSGPERAKLAHAKSGFRVPYIALVVEYVAKYAPATVATGGGVTEAVLHTLDHTGRACEESDGPVDYDVDVDPVREMWRRAKQERKEWNARVRRWKGERYDEPADDDVDPVREMWRRAKQERKEWNARVRRWKGGRDEEINGADSLAAQSNKRKTSVRRNGKLFVQRAPGSMHKFAPDKQDTEGEGKRAKSSATPTRVLHGGAIRSPHFSRSGQRFAPKRRGQDAEGRQESVTGKRRRVL